MICHRPGQLVTRRVIGASQVIFNILLMYVTAGGLDSALYLFISLSLLVFYRDWRLLVLVGAAVLVAQYSYSRLGCAVPVVAGTTQGFVQFAVWVVLEVGVLVLICTRGTVLFRSNAQEAARLELEREQAYGEVLERTRQLETSNEQYRALLESTSAVPWELDDTSGRCTYIGAQVRGQWGWEPGLFQQSGFLFNRVLAEDQPAFAQALEDAAASHDVVVECRFKLAGQGIAYIRSFVRHAPGVTAGRIVRGISIDITAQKQLEMELQQAQKLESVGRLAAGIAHEINTPVQFVSDNCHFLRDAVGEMSKVLSAYREACMAAASGSMTAAEVVDRGRAAEQAADLDFLTENMPKAVERSLEGLDRVATIVRSMKEFSHPHQDAPSSADLNAAIRSTLTIARNEYKYLAELHTDLGEIPPVVCYVGELNQVFLNIIVNAAHAIGDVVAGRESKGLITVSTRQDGDDVVVSIEDTGGGIAAAIQDKVFDPFFTTKEVGRGTGQGLAIARSVVVDKHGGRLTFESQPGIGTTFLIRLPIAGRTRELDAVSAESDIDG